MIAVIVFAITLLLLSFGAAWVLDFADDHRLDIACDCGLRVVRNAIIVDSIDARHIEQLLTEGCPVCRCNRRLRRRSVIPNPQSKESARAP